MGGIVIPEMSVEIQRRDMPWEKLGSGLSRGIVAESISFTHSFESSIGGPATATMVLTDVEKRQRPDLEHFTPVVIRSGNKPVFSGRVIRTPEVRADKYQRTIELQGWKEHLKDAWYDKAYVITDLTRFSDDRSAPNATLGVSKTSANGQVNVGDGAITLMNPNAQAILIDSLCGVYIDLGPNNVAKRVIVNYQSSNNTANNKLVLTDCSSADPWVGGASSSALAVNNAGATGTLRISPTAATSRYIHIYNQVITAGYTPSADVFFKITSILICTSTAYESGDASALHSSDVIKDVLTTKCPLISSDQSNITTTSFAIPEFHTGLGEYEQPFSLIDRGNSFNGYQVVVSSDPVAKVTYRPVPTTPMYALGEGDAYEFENPGTYDGSEVYSKVIGQFTDATGAPGVVTVTVPSSGVQNIPTTDGAVTNPSFATNTTGWTVAGSGTPLITRDTTVFNSTPASGRFELTSTTTPLGSDAILTGALTGTFNAGQTYSLQVAVRVVNQTDPGTVKLQFGTSSDSTTQLVSGGVGSFIVYSMTWSPTTTVSSGVNLSVSSYTGASITQIYVDDVTLLKSVSNVVNRRGFSKEHLRKFTQRMTTAAATQVCQLILDASQFPPLKGTIKKRGRIRLTTGSSVHGSQLQLGQVVLLEDERDPNTGAIGRMGVLQAFTYERDSDTTTLTLDSVQGFYENLIARLSA